jgi:hypothetical protein
MTYAMMLREVKGRGNGREAFGLSGCAAEGYKKDAVFFCRQMACIVP